MWVGSSQNCSVPSAEGKDRLRREGKAIQINPPGFSFEQIAVSVVAGVAMCSTT